MTYLVLDVCCSVRGMWFDKTNPLALYGDIRSTTLRVNGSWGSREWDIKPDVQFDYRQLPFRDETFRIVMFDPPHILMRSSDGLLAKKFGSLTTQWKDELRRGFAECFRVLHDYGVLAFKWSEADIPMHAVAALAGSVPLIGHTSGKRFGTHWAMFLKEPR